MSMAECASVNRPPGPAPLAERRSLAAMASTCVGSSPISSFASESTAVRNAGVSEPPKNVTPMPTRPWSVPSSRVTNSRVSVGAGRPTTRGLSAGVRSTRVVTWVIFIGCPPLRRSGRSAGGDPTLGPGPARVERVSRLIEVHDEGGVVGGDRLALAGLAIDLRPHDSPGQRGAHEQVIDPHPEVLVEVAGAVVPPGVAA